MTNEEVIEEFARIQENRSKYGGEMQLTID